MPLLLHQLWFSLVPGGCKVTAGEIRVRQREGWAAISRDQIHAVKFRSISHVIVRLFDGRRLVLNLFRFPNYQWDRLGRALRESQRANEAARKSAG